MGRRVKAKSNRGAKSADLRTVTKKRISAKKGKQKMKMTQSCSARVDELLEMAEECMEMLQIEAAEKYCRQAVEMEPERPEALEMLGVVLLESVGEGVRDEAIGLMRRAVELQPDNGHSKYMYLGQMLAGGDALQCFLKGIQIMEMTFEKQKSMMEGDDAAKALDVEDSGLSLDLSNAYCAVAELYLTDLCLEGEAEAECEACCTKALEYSPGNPESLQVSATFLLSANRLDEAKERIKQSVTAWLTIPENPDDEGLVDINALEKAPPYAARQSAVKILVEVGEYDIAYQVIDTLLAEDDEVVAVWYLAGWLCYLRGEEYASQAVKHLFHAKQLAAKVDCDDMQMLQHVDELLGLLEHVDHLEDDGHADEEENDQQEEKEDLETAGKQMDVH